MWPPEKALLETSDLYPDDDNLSLCSIDTEGSIYEDGSTPYYTCLELPSLLACSKEPNQSISCDSFLSCISSGVDVRSTLPSLQHDSIDSQLHFYYKLDYLEPAKLIKPSREAQFAKDLYLPYPSLIDVPIGETIEVDLGSKEQVSNTELHSLELEYQQEQFELIQREKKLESISTESATIYYAPPHTRPASSMVMTSGKAPPPKRIKLIINEAIKSMKESPSTSTVAKGQKIEEKAIGKKSTLLNLNDLPINAQLDGESGERLISYVFGKENAQKILKENDVRITIHKDGVRWGHSIQTVVQEHQQSVGTQSTLEYRASRAQTIDKTSTDESSETDKEQAIEYKNEESQVEYRTNDDSEEELKIKAWRVVEFDQSPLQRRLLTRHHAGEIGVDLIWTLQTEKVQETVLMDAQTSCGYERRLKVATIAERMGIDQGVMTEENIIKVGSENGHGDYASLQRRVNEENKAHKAQFTDPDVLQAIDALTSLYSQKMTGIEQEGHELIAGIVNEYGHPTEIGKIDEIALHDQLTNDSKSDFQRNPDFNSRDLKEVNCSEGQDHNVDLEMNTIHTSKQESTLEDSLMTSKKKIRGRKKKSGEQKEADIRLKEMAKAYNLVRRSSRSTNMVDYKETGRAALGVKVEGKMPNSIEPEASSNYKTKKRTTESSHYEDELHTTPRGTHPKEKHKKNKR